jgi:hypothetical protein
LGKPRSTHDFFDAPVESALVVEVGVTPPLARVAPFTGVLELAPPGTKSGGTTRVVPAELAVGALGDVVEVDIGLVEPRTRQICDK